VAILIRLEYRPRVLAGCADGARSKRGPQPLDLGALFLYFFHSVLEWADQRAQSLDLGHEMFVVFAMIVPLGLKFLLERAYFI
jgi:hypothetical protein